MNADTILLFKKIATKVHHDASLNDFISLLPEDVKKAFFENDFQQLRKIISDSNFFPDSKLVTVI